MLVLIPFLLQPVIRFGVEIFLAVADVCMPGLRRVIRVRVRGTDGMAMRIIHFDIKVERLGWIGTT